MPLKEKYKILLEQIEQGVLVTYMDLYELPNKEF